MKIVCWCTECYAVVVHAEIGARAASEARRMAQVSLTDESVGVHGIQHATYSYVFVASSNDERICGSAPFSMQSMKEDTSE